MLFIIFVLLSLSMSDSTDLETYFSNIVKENSNLAKLESIGTSVKNRSIWALKISENVQKRELLKPMFKYVANIHGDETVGREILIKLANYLVTNFNTDERVTKLLKTTYIYIAPSVNPDGYEATMEYFPDECTLGNRTNANHVDLNRDFPNNDFANYNNKKISFVGRQPETVAIMKWILNNPFVLSVSLHGGSVVASYPYDTGLKDETYSKAPDDNVFVSLAHLYASNHKTMSTKKDICKGDNFKDGITNGNEWYSVPGGMQDFNYLYSNCFEITIELSCCKNPPNDQMNLEWENNKESLLSLLEATHWGIKGFVQTEDSKPIKSAKIEVEGINYSVLTTANGEYWRLLTPGTYKVIASAPSYKTEEKTVIVQKNGHGSAFVLNFTLSTIPYRSGYIGRVYSKIDQYGFLIPIEFKHHNYKEMEAALIRISLSYPSITRLYSIGKSVKNRELYVLEISDNPGIHEPGEPEVKYVANMHGNEVVGREMLLLLMEYICQNYGTNDSVTNIVNNTRLHLLPSMNPDGYEISVLGDRISLHGRANANNVDLNRNFPDRHGTMPIKFQPETEAIMNWMSEYQFVLSGNLHGGSLVVNYPYDDDSTHVNDQKLSLSPDNKMFLYLSKSYSYAHSMMSKGIACPQSKPFPEGIVNGNTWYTVIGGMQDYNYVFHNCMEVTIEMGCFKYPYARELPHFWMDNREALLEYVHQGISGFITSSSGNAVANATIQVKGISKIVKSGKAGDYWRLLTPGKYFVTALAPGYESQSKNVTVRQGKTSVNFTLMRDDPNAWSVEYDYSISANINPITSYLSDYDIYNELNKLDEAEPSIASFSDIIGVKSLKLSKDVAMGNERKIHIGILGGLVEPVGRELSLRLARHIFYGYKRNDPTIKYILAEAVLHFIPVINEVVEGPCHANLSFNNPIPILNLLKDESFDLLISIDSGNFSLQHAGGKNFQYKAFMESFENSAQMQDSSCLGSYFNKNVKHSLMNRIQKGFNLLMISVETHCCNYVQPNEIPVLWRQLVPIFLSLLETSIQGVQVVVTDLMGQPMRQAQISVHGINYTVTKNLAVSKIILPPGNYNLKISCSHHITQEIEVIVERGKLSKVKVELEPVNIKNSAAPSPLNGIGIAGYIVDDRHHPVKDAFVIVEGEQIKQNTNENGAYWIPLDLGEHTLVGSADGYSSTTKFVKLTENKHSQQVLFVITKNQSVMGLPRLIFIIIFAITSVASLGICLMLYFMCKKDGNFNDTGFTLLDQVKNDDDDDDEETELFKMPIRGTPLKVTPYYDNSEVEYESDLSEEEVFNILDNKNAIQRK